ncbi:hypothetical protein Bca52824_091700 [Brassica carinata]|uniref:NPK1-activating kinesin-like protein C-terminal domain-containing protein n=1 Tax=Brassica carinata TaxID=52824 RepID=A0A8X7NX13_BRACI|nr:hypothetical protein Bca52824_091700 [Brassica carinata]
MSEKALQKQLQRELARLQTEPGNPASKCDCAITVRKKDGQIQKMEKQIAKLIKQRDLAESRLEDFMRIIEHHHALKSGTLHFGNHKDKWEDGSVSDTSGVVNLLDTRSFISDDDDDDDDINEELPMRSEDPSDEYCREVQCIEIEETATVYSNNHNDEKEETKNVLGLSEDHANDETSVGQNVNHIDTVPGTGTPPENLGEDFHGRQECVFPDFEFGSSVSRNDSMSSCEGNSSGIPTPLGEEGGISTIQTFVDGLKEMSKRHQEVSVAEASGKMGRDLGVEGDFKRKRQEILELWQSCNVSLVRRTYFYLLFKGDDDESDSVYIGVELRRLLSIKDRFSQGKEALDGGETLTLASSLKALHKERKMLSKLMRKRFSEEERTRIYHKFGIAVNSKRRRLQLVNGLWSNPKDMSQVVESADVVSKLVKFTEQGKAMKEMFGPAFTHPSLLTTQKAHGWRKNMPTLF